MTVPTVSHPACTMTLKNRAGAIIVPVGACSSARTVTSPLMIASTGTEAVLVESGSIVTSTEGSSMCSSGRKAARSGGP